MFFVNVVRDRETKNTEAAWDYFLSLLLDQRRSELSVQKRSLRQEEMGGRGVTVERDMLGHQCQEQGWAARSRHWALDYELVLDTHLSSQVQQHSVVSVFPFGFKTKEIIKTEK